MDLIVGIVVGALAWGFFGQKITDFVRGIPADLRAEANKLIAEGKAKLVGTTPPAPPAAS